MMWAGHASLRPLSAVPAFTCHSPEDVSFVFNSIAYSVDLAGE